MIFNFRKRTQEISEKTTTSSKMRKFLPYVSSFLLIALVLLPKSVVFGASLPIPPIPSLSDVIPNLSVSKLVMTYVAILMYFIMQAMSGLLWLSGILLNYVLQVTVVDMSAGLKGMLGIDVTWRVIRDVVNIFFIFILVKEGIMIILSKSTTTKAFQIIGGIILTAVLINFSVFFTKVIIDASNMATLGFYKSIYEAGQDQNVTLSVTETTQKVINGGISGAFTNALKISSFFTAETAGALVGSTDSDDNYKLTVMSLGGIVLFLILAFVFFAVSMMFIIRYVTFIILLMFSPLGFVGYGLPKLQDVQKKWWEALIGQAIFAPLYMFLTWAVLTLISSGVFFKTDGNWSDLFTGVDGKPSPSSVSLVLNFIIIIFLAIFTLTKSREFAKQGSGAIGNATSMLTTFAGGVIMGGAAAVGRRTIGAGALRGTTVEELESRAASGDLTAKTRLALAKGSFDIRRSFAGEKIAKATETDFGKGLPNIPFTRIGEKSGEGGLAGTRAEKKKIDEGKLDLVADGYVKKRDWAGLATFMQNKPAFRTQSDWEKDQKYIYKKLSERDRVSLEKELESRTPGVMPNPLVDRLRGTLPIDDQIKAYVNKKDWGGLATLIGSKPTMSERSYIYEKLSPRERVELDTELAKSLATAGMTATLRASLSAEERDKTEKIAKEEAKKIADKDRFDNIDKLVSGTPVPAGVTFDSLIGPGSKFAPKDARNLSIAALNNPQVIERLSARHLADIISNHEEIDESTKKTIRDHIISAPSGSYPLLDEQIKYLGSNKGVEAAWGV